MDEPFSALDVFTAETLRSEVYRLWTGGGPGHDAHLPSSLKSILMITHIIEEAVFLADRIVIMGTRPGRIRQILTNALPHPRSYQDPKFLGMVNRLHDIIVSEHLPEQPEAPATTAAAQEVAGYPMPEPLPCINLNQMIGLMEIVRDRGGRVDVFALDKLTDYDFGYTLSVAKAGELLGLLDTPKNDVVLTELGNQFLDGDINVRKALLNQQLRKLSTFRFVIRILQDAKGHRLPKDVVEEELAIRLPTEQTEGLFKTVVSWGRFSELFEYGADAEVLYLEEPATSATKST